ncbi:hypothetical protein [Cryptosporangium japonicum]|uniref:Uncharacterized protein n=1 Tax=Cryptosporangium japonicum TaxID=80872 RepID=A0ABN0U2S9_9ACTN
MIIDMDRYEGRCWLDWWANSSTLLGSAEVTVVITASDAGWDARAELISGDGDEREGLVLLCDLDPVFTLRFEDRSTVPVMVHMESDDRITLTQYSGSARRSIDHQIDL